MVLSNLGGADAAIGSGSISESVKPENHDRQPGIPGGLVTSAPGTARARTLELRLLSSLLLVCLNGLASPGSAESAGIETHVAPGSSGSKPVSGRTVIPRMTSQAATNQARVCAELCDMLPRVTLESAAYHDPKSPGKSLRYRLFTPGPLVPARTYPLALFLHGGGARQSFGDLLKCSSPVFSFGAARLVAPGEQARHPAFVLVPWSGGGSWDENTTPLLLALLDALCRELPIDSKRLYVTGQSMGGYGTWRMITEHPDVFAAGIPVCGGGDTAAAPKAKHVPVWAFHGSADGLVAVSETRRMIDALLRVGGKPIYWEYDGGTHAGTAERAYCEAELLDWLFTQSK